MNESGTSHGSPSSPSHALSPLIKPLPNGYRDLAPLRKGQGWHANGRLKRTKASPQKVGEFGSPVRSPDRVVFPYIGGYIPHGVSDNRPGPDLTDVQGVFYPDQDDRNEEDCSPSRIYDQTQSSAPDTSGSSPRIDDPIVRVAFRPQTPQHAWVGPPSAPRRPKSMGSSPYAQQNSGGASFRARTFTSAGTPIDNNNSTLPHPTVPSAGKPLDIAFANTKDAAVQASLPKKMRHISDLFSSDEVPGDPVLMQQLWQEYAERAARGMDKQEYHRKMQHKYNERKALRDRVAELEQQLTAANREREELVCQLSEPDSTFSSPQYTNERPAHSPAQSPNRSPNKSPNRSPSPSPTTFTMPLVGHDEYRQRNVYLEQALNDAKNHLEDTEDLLVQQRTEMMCEIDTLKANLQLERRTNENLSLRLRETEISFQNTADELINTRLHLEKETIARHEATQHAMHTILSLETRHRQELVVYNAKQALLKLGRQALYEKVRVFHSRTVVAEQRMRAALEQVTNLQQQVDDQQRQLEQVLTHHEFSHNSLKAPVNLTYSESSMSNSHGMVVYQGPITITGYELLLRVVCEDSRPSQSNENSSWLFNIRFLAFEPLSKQYDSLVFAIEDIQRLIIGHQKYFKCTQTLHRRQCTELAGQLLKHVQAGFKNGRLVLCEMPALATPELNRSCADLRKISGLTKLDCIPIFKGIHRLERCTLPPTADPQKSLDSVAAEVIINKVTDSENDREWWLEIYCTALDLIDLDPDDSGCTHEFTLKVTSTELEAICADFLGYCSNEHNPHLKSSEAQEYGQIMAVHEELLDPLLQRLCLCVSSNGRDETHSLVIRTIPNESIAIASTAVDARIESLNDLSISPKDDVVCIPERRLDHRGIVNMGGIFYCARFLEIWDDEVMLEAILEDPESFTRLSGILYQYQIAAIIEHLKTSGAVLECESQLDMGIPADFHAPICKLLVQHLRKSDCDISLAVSFDSLLAMIGEKHSAKPVCNVKTSVAERSIDQAETATIIRADMHLQIEVMGCQGKLSERDALELFTQTKISGSKKLSQTRKGVRICAGDGYHSFAFVHCFRGFLNFDGMIAVMYPIYPQQTTVSRVLVLSSNLASKALELLGVERA